MNRDFTAAPEREARGARDDGHLGAPQSLGRALERAHHHVDFVPVGLLRFEQQQH